MAKKADKKSKTKEAIRKQSGADRKKKVNWEFPLTKQNMIVAAVGLGIIILGYILMSTGITEEPAVPDGTWNNPMAVTVAPVLLVIGYCIVIPYAIIKVFRKKEN